MSYREETQSIYEEIAIVNSKLAEIEKSIDQMPKGRAAFAHSQPQVALRDERGELYIWVFWGIALFGGGGLLLALWGVVLVAEYRQHIGASICIVGALLLLAAARLAWLALPRRTVNPRRAEIIELVSRAHAHAKKSLGPTDGLTMLLERALRSVGSSERDRWDYFHVIELSKESAIAMAENALHWFHTLRQPDEPT